MAPMSRARLTCSGLPTPTMELLLSGWVGSCTSSHARRVCEPCPRHCQHCKSKCSPPCAGAMRLFSASFEVDGMISLEYPRHCHVLRNEFCVGWMSCAMRSSMHAEDMHRLPAFATACGKGSCGASARPHRPRPKLADESVGKPPAESLSDLP